MKSKVQCPETDLKMEGVIGACDWLKSPGSLELWSRGSLFYLPCGSGAENKRTGGGFRDAVEIRSRSRKDVHPKDLTSGFP